MGKGRVLTQLMKQQQQLLVDFVESIATFFCEKQNRNLLQRELIRIVTYE